MISNAYLNQKVITVSASLVVLNILITFMLLLFHSPPLPLICLFLLLIDNDVMNLPPIINMK